MMNSMEQNLKAAVMRRVYRVYFLRKIVTPCTVKTVAVLAFAVAGSYFVSLPHIFANARYATHFYDLIKFFTVAFLNTHFIVQVLSLGILALFAFAIRDVVRGVRALGLMRTEQIVIQ